jgi:hypothetical protein
MPHVCVYLHGMVLNHREKTLCISVITFFDTVVTCQHLLASYNPEYVCIICISFSIKCHLLSVVLVRSYEYHMLQNPGTLYASKLLCYQLPETAISSISNTAHFGSSGSLCGSCICATLDESARL